MSLKDVLVVPGFLVGRLLLLEFVDELLAEPAPLDDGYLQDGPTQLVLGYNSFGKPFLVRGSVGALLAQVNLLSRAPLGSAELATS